MSPAWTSTSASEPTISCVNAACASRSARLPAGSPGKHRLRFLPSSGTTNGVRARNAGTFRTGTAHTLPRSSRSARARVHWRTAAIGAYSHPCTPARTVSRGPSPAPVSSTTGMSWPARPSVRRCTFGGMNQPSLTREKLLGGRGGPEQCQVSAPSASELNAHWQASAGNGKRDRRMAGEIVWAGEAALCGVLPDAERRVLLRRLVPDRGAGQDIDAGEARLDRGCELRAVPECGRVLLRADGRAEPEQRPGALRVPVPDPALVNLECLRGHNDGERVVPLSQLAKPRRSDLV